MRTKPAWTLAAIAIPSLAWGDTSRPVTSKP
jgi:hypothetical protein